MTTTRSTDVLARGPGDPAVLLRTLIGQALRRLRLRQGRTLREVADAAQVSMPYLSEIERGRKEASSEVLAAICRALGVRLSDLLEDVRDDLLELEPDRPVVGFAVHQARRQSPTGAAGASSGPGAAPRASASASASVEVRAAASAAIDVLDQMVDIDWIVPSRAPRPVRRTAQPYFDVRCQVLKAA